MRVRATWLLVSVCLLAGLAALMLLDRHANEPQYQGRPLSYWLLQAEATLSPDLAQAALNEAGTNAVPHLLKWIQYEPPRWRKKLVHNRLGTFLRPLTHTRQESLAVASCNDFPMLGTNAFAAIPKLVMLIHNTNAPLTAVWALHALGRLGTNGLLPIISAMQDPRYAFRFPAVAAIASGGQQPASLPTITPVLVQCLKDVTDLRIPEMAAMSLGNNAYAPDLSIPALTNCLASPDPILRSVAAGSLAHFAGQATDALPILTQALADTDPRVRNAATNAITAITMAPRE